MASITKNLGIVAPVPVGEWNAETTYQKLNVVRHNGSSYMATQSSVATEPGVATNWAQYWQLLVKDGNGTEVIPNPTLEGDEEELTGLEVNGTKYKVPCGGEQVSVEQTKGQSATAVMSQKAVTDSLNDLEAKLNENVIKNPDYTYIITTATSFDLSQPPFADEFSIDWGDGTTGDQDNPIHTYTDGYTYHLLTIKNITSIQAGFSYVPAYSKSFIEIYMGINAVFNISGPSGVDAFNNLRKVVYQEGLTVVNLPSKFEGTIVIPKSCTQINLSSYQSSKISKIVIQNTDPAAFTTVSVNLSYVDKIVVPKSAINAYKTASKWSAFADKIVYEVDSSDLPDLSGYAEKNSYNTFTKPQYIKPDSDTELGWTINKKDSNDYTSYEYGKILHTLDNIHTMLTFLFPDKSGTLALTSDTEAAKAYADSLNVIYIESSLLGE